MKRQRARRFAAIAVAGIGMALVAPPSGRGQESPGAGEDLAALAAQELARGAAAEAEELLREALQKKRDPKLLLELGAVLVERASVLDSQSELGQSLRLGILEEALALDLEAAKSPEHAADGAIGASRCHSQLGRDEAAEAILREGLARLRQAGAALPDRRRLLRELVLFLALRGRADDANAAVAAAKSAGDVDEGGVALETLQVAAASREHERVLPLALAAVDAKADAFDVAWVCWDAFVDLSQAAAGDRSRLEKLLNVYSKLLERRPGDTALLYYRGVTRHYMGDRAGALADLERARADPRLGNRAQVYYARALITLKRSEEALPVFERLLAEDATLKMDALGGIVGVAVMRATARNYAGALELYQRVLAADPTSLWARIGEPLTLRNLGRLDEAASAYEEGLRVLRDEPQLLNDYALLLKARGERAKAKEYFERALGAGSADGGENLGILAYRDEHDFEQAARYFARALLIDPNRPRVRFYRELCLCDGKRE
jgi:tetratricopeptide (TPR) repeat protein